MEMHPFYLLLDPYLISFYRLTGHAGTDFVIGTLFLAGISLAIGKATVFLAYRFISKRLQEKTEEATKYHDLSIDALKAGDKEAYRATNKLANEAFGHSFFQQAALSAAFLWPVFFALAWMQYRFLEVEFPLPFSNLSLGYIGVFILLYVALYFLWNQVAKKLKHFSEVKDLQNPSLNRDSGGLSDAAVPHADL